MAGKQKKFHQQVSTFNLIQPGRRGKGCNVVFLKLQATNRVGPGSCLLCLRLSLLSPERMITKTSSHPDWNVTSGATSPTCVD